MNVNRCCPECGGFDSKSSLCVGHGAIDVSGEEPALIAVIAFHPGSGRADRGDNADGYAKTDRVSYLGQSPA